MGRAGPSRQRVFKRAFEPAVVRVVKNVIDDGAGARPFDGDGDAQVDQFERIAVADVDAREARSAAVALPDDGGVVGFRLCFFGGDEGNTNVGKGFFALRVAESLEDKIFPSPKCYPDT